MNYRYLLAFCLFLPVGASAQEPQNLGASAGDQQASLTWDALQLDEDERLLCYGVYRDTSSLADTDPEDLPDQRIADVDSTGSPSYTDTEVTNGTTYYYRVTAESAEEEDGALSCGGSEVEESSFSNQASATPFAPVNVQIDQPTVSDPVEALAPIEVTVQATNVPSKEPMQLHYRRGGEEAFTTASMNRDGTTFTASIPGDPVTARGVEFFVQTKNERGEAVRAPEDGIRSVRVEAGGLSFTQPGGTAQTAYRIVSFPTVLDDARLSELLEETLGPYDPEQWRLFSIGENGLSASGGYVEQSDTDARLEEGDGIWLISRSGGEIRAGSGVSIRTDQPFQIPLQSGWNLIGNPFAFEVPLSQLRVQNSAGSLQDVFGYNGTFVPKTTGDVLEPYQGYLVRLSDGQAGTLVIDPTHDDPSSTRKAQQGASTMAWHVDVAARVDRARDSHNTFGVASTATGEVGAEDGREPPPLGQYVSLAFQSGSGRPLLWRDVRAADGTLHTWTARVRTNVSGRVTLSADDVQTVPDDQEVWLVDPALDIAQNLREASRYRFPASGEQTTRRIRFLVGPSTAVRQELGRKASLPQEVGLSPSVPHPVRTHATFRYRVPSSTRVTLTLFDLLGRQVATLVDGKRVEAGTHAHSCSARANGEALSSGTYLLRLNAGGTTRTRRIVVVR